MSDPCKQEETIGQMKQHMEEGIAFRKDLSVLFRVVVFQAIAFAFGYGLLTANVKEIGKTVEAYAEPIEDFKRHIDVDESRWELYRVEDAHKLRDE